VTYESSAPGILVEDSAKDTIPSNEVSEPSTTDAVDNKSIPMDYRARRALRQKQKDIESGEHMWLILSTFCKRMR